MRKIILALLIALLPAAALAQSAPPNLGYHTVYGRLGAVPGDTGPGEALPFASLQALLGGVFGPGSSTVGHIVTWNNALGTIVADGGAISALWTNGLGVMPCANMAALTGDTTSAGGTCVTVVHFTSPLTGGTQRTLTGKLSEYVSIFDFGAFGDCVNDDTAAFQAAYTSNAAHIHVPVPPGGCYLVTKVNGTNHNNIIWEGDGDQSLIKINGQDAQGNWWDLSGSNNIQFKNLKFINNGSAVRIAFLWACTGTNCGTSGIVSGLNFDHVDVDGKFVLAGLYAYGYGPLTGPFTGGGAMSITNSTWRNTFNSSTLVGERTRTAVLDLTAYNIGAVTSAYVTITATTAIASQTNLFNTIINDSATTGSTLSNNAAIVADGVNQFTMTGGQVGCLCISDVIGWTSVEGMTFTQTAFQVPLGGNACITTFWAEFGGGINAAIGFHNVLFSCPGTGGAIIGLDQGIAAANGGIWFLTFEGADVGLNSFSDPFIGKTAAGCGSFTATNNWILQSNLNLVGGANNIVTCGSIDAKTIIQNAGTITIQSGGTDHGTANPFR